MYKYIYTYIHKYTAENIYFYFCFFHRESDIPSESLSRKFANHISHVISKYCIVYKYCVYRDRLLFLNILLLLLLL